MCGLQWEFIVYIITVKFPADKYKTGGHPIECPPAVRYLAPRLNLRFAFFCSRSCASRRFASSTARSTSSGPNRPHACDNIKRSDYYIPERKEK